jgi:hypothetical protein
MTPTLVRHPWPGALDWGGDWLADTERELAHLGFVLRDGTSPSVMPGPRLLVALRDQPTLEHFDPEVVTYWVAAGGRGHVATLDRRGLRAAIGEAGEAPHAVPWSWGPIRVTDRVPVSNGFLGFGGTLLVDSTGDSATYAAFTSRAPIVRWAGHSQGVDFLVDEVGAFFARLMVPVDYQPGAETRVAAADPEALYAVFLGYSIRRLHGSRRLRDADLKTAGWLEHEGHRLEREASGHWAEGQELLGWLELG